MHHRSLSLSVSRKEKSHSHIDDSDASTVSQSAERTQKAEGRKDFSKSLFSTFLRTGKREALVF